MQYLLHRAVCHGEPLVDAIKGDDGSYMRHVLRAIRRGVSIWIPALTLVMVFYGWTETSFRIHGGANFVVHCFFRWIRGACAIPRLTEISILDVISSTNALSSVMS